ncbi:MAG: SAM-dependent methyltransferase, partial [Mesorhizobium sp.]
MAHGPGLRRTLAEKFDDELKFFKGWIDKPKAVGSIVPTSSITARKMASVVNPM